MAVHPRKNTLKVGNRTDGGRQYNAANAVVCFTYDDAGNHTPAPVTPPSAPHPAPQEPSRDSTIHSTPWGMDESLVCTQEGFPMPEADDFKVTIFPAPQEGAVLVLLVTPSPEIGYLPLSVAQTKP